ncbi:hypothetical protein PS15p_205608 [Mucor circinelloides]
MALVVRYQRVCFFLVVEHLVANLMVLASCQYRQELAIGTCVSRSLHIAHLLFCFSNNLNQSLNSGIVILNLMLECFHRFYDINVCRLRALSFLKRFFRFSD